MKLGYLGIDQYGQRYKINKHPRKELLEQLGRKHAVKMYCDTKKGITKHTGYIISGNWITIYEVHEWKRKLNHR
jgi:hypothetical protein